MLVVLYKLYFKYEVQPIRARVLPRGSGIYQTVVLSLFSITMRDNV